MDDRITERLQLRCTRQLKRKIEKIAKERVMTTSEFLRDLVYQELEKLENDVYSDAWEGYKDVILSKNPKLSRRQLVLIKREFYRGLADNDITIESETIEELKAK